MYEKMPPGLRRFRLRLAIELKKQQLRKLWLACQRTSAVPVYLGGTAQILLKYSKEINQLERELRDA